MTDFYAVTDLSIPEKLHDRDADSCVRFLSAHERLAIEDRFFAAGHRVAISPNTTAVVISQDLLDVKAAEEYCTLSEFALGMLALSGFHSINKIAHFSGGACTYAIQPAARESCGSNPTFGKSINGVATSRWLRQFFVARKNTQGRMHITADRFVRYLRGRDSGDSLTDLCISLESLLDSQTEIKFKFGTSLARLTGKKGQEAIETADVLEDLYDLRSKVVHGDPAAVKLRQKMETKLPKLRIIARAVLTRYVLFMSEHTRSDWKKHLRNVLFE
jgi:hypothetical protein